MGDKTGIEWRDIPGKPGYLVNNYGYIRGPRKPNLKRLYTDSGHAYVMVRRKKLYVHHAVLLAFVGPCPPGHECRHLNDNPTDNRLKNLCWGTREENWDDRKRNGRVNTSHLERIDQRTADQIRATAGTSRTVGAQFGVSHTTVLEIRRGNRWQGEGNYER